MTPSYENPPDSAPDSHPSLSAADRQFSTPGEQYRLHAWHLAERIPIKNVSEVLVSLGFPEGEHLDPAGTDLVVNLGEASWCFLYHFGSIVFFNAATPTRERILSAIRTAVRSPAKITSDDFGVLVEKQATERVAFDNAVLTDLTVSKVAILAVLLAQSTALEYHERLVEELLDGAEAITEPMKRHGRLPGYNRNMIRYIGFSLSTRRELVSSLYVIDAPDITWEDVALDRLFNQMKATMDVDARYRALEYKLKLVQEGVEVMVDLTNAQRNIWLEAVIVGLILVEIALALIGIH